MPLSGFAHLLATLGLSTLAAAPGFDCGKASGAVDRMICSDDRLAQTDYALARRYAELQHALSPEGAAVLRASQRRWLVLRTRCVAPESPREQAATCLDGLYTERTDELTMQYATGDGLAIENRETRRRVPRQRVDEFDSYPVLLGPWQRVDGFNRYVRQRLKLANGQFAASGIRLDPKPPGDTSFSRHYEVHRLDAGLISIEILQYHESYFGHGWRSEYTINWDLRHGRPLRTADLFRADSDWQQGVYDHAMQYLREQGEMQDPAGWFGIDAVDDSDAWLFDQDGALLLLGHGERSMVGASAAVPIPYEVLKPLLRPEAAIAILGK